MPTTTNLPERPLEGINCLAERMHPWKILAGYPGRSCFTSKLHFQATRGKRSVSHWWLRQQRRGRR